MSRTINRLSDNDALLSYSTSSGLASPLSGTSESISSVLYYGDSTVIGLTYRTKVKPNSKIVLSPAQSSSIYVDGILTASTHLASNISGTYTTSSVSTAVTSWGGTQDASISTLTETVEFFKDETASVATRTRRNLVTNPSFTTNTTGWTANASTLARITTDSYIGTACARVTSSTTNYNNIISASIAVTPNARYTLSAYAKNLSGSTRTVYVAIQWFTSAGVYISETNSTSQGTLSTAAGWRRRNCTGIAPSNAAQAKVALVSGTTGLSSGWQTLWDAVLFEEAAYTNQYFDGSTYSSSVSFVYTDTNQELSDTSLASGSVSFSPTSGTVTPIYSDRWLSSENATISVTSEGQSLLDVYTLKISPNSTSDVTVYINNTGLVLEDNGRRFSFNAKIHPPFKSIVNGKLVVDGQAAGDGYEQELFGGRYGAVRTNTVTIPTSSSATYSVSASISISGHNGQPIYMTLPHLIDDEMYYENIFVNQSRLYMPDFYWEIDSQQTNPIAPFHRLIDCLFNLAGETYETYKEYFPYEVNEISTINDQLEKITNSTLVNPNYVEPGYMTWLAQFNGSKLKRNIIGSDGERLYDSTALEDEYSRWQLLTGYYGKSAGSRDAILSAAKRVLYKLDNSTFSVAISRRFQNDPFKIQIITLVAETPDVDIEGGESAMIIDAVEPARPMGYVIYHTTVEKFEFTLDNDTLGILDEFPLA